MTSPLTPRDLERYSRHLALPEVGEEGQEKLENSRVAIIGLGGLGSPAALYLAAAGIGKLVFVDPDTVSASNLHRQIIHSELTLGKQKTTSAAERIKGLNPYCIVTCCQTKLTRENAAEITAGCDLIVDATDNFAARFIINDAACLHRIPLVYGAIRRFEGQAAVFEPHRGTSCYRCLHPESPPAGHDDEASAEGLLGPLPGIIGSIQAMEALKCLLGIPSPLSGKMLIADTMKMQFRQVELRRDPLCKCSDI